VGIVAAFAYLLIGWCLKRSYRLTLLISIHTWASFLAIPGPRFWPSFQCFSMHSFQAGTFQPRGHSSWWFPTSQP
jgi:hypothetical protein